MIALSILFLLFHGVLTSKLVAASAIKVDIAWPHKNIGTTIHTRKLLHGVREWVFTVTNPRDVISEINDSGSIIHPDMEFSVTSFTLLWGLTRRFLQIPMLSDVLTRYNELERNVYYEYANGCWRRSTSYAYYLCKREHMHNVDMDIPCVENEYIDVSEKVDQLVVCLPRSATTFIKSIVVNGLTSWLPENPYTRSHLFGIVYPNKAVVDAVTLLTLDDDANVVNISDFYIVNSRLHPVQKPNRKRITVLQRLHNGWAAHIEANTSRFIIDGEVEGRAVGIVPVSNDSSVSNNVTSAAGTIATSTDLNPDQISLDFGSMIVDNEKYFKVAVSDSRGLGCGYLARPSFTFAEAKFGDTTVFRNPTNPPFYLVRYIAEPTVVYAFADAGDELKLICWFYDGEWKETTVDSESWVPWAIDLDITQPPDRRFFHVRDKRIEGMGNILYMPRDLLAVGKILDGSRLIRELQPPAPAHVEVDISDKSCTVTITFDCEDGVKYATHKRIPNGRWRVEESNMPTLKRRRK